MILINLSSLCRYQRGDYQDTAAKKVVGILDLPGDLDASGNKRGATVVTSGKYTGESGRHGRFYREPYGVTVSDSSEKRGRPLRHYWNQNKGRSHGSAS